MTSFVAHFNGGPANGEVRHLQPDTIGSTEAPREVKVAEFREGELRMVSYLRSEHPMKNGHWAYAYTPPKD